MKRIGIAAGMALALTACGGGDGYSASDIMDQVPQGRLDGQSWTMISAVVEEDAFDPDELSVDLYAEQVDPCGFGSGERIMFQVPRAVGEYPLKFEFGGESRTVTFYVPPGSNTIASEGIIVIESIDGTTITMGLVAHYDDDFTVNGRFTTKICE